MLPKRKSKPCQTLQHGIRKAASFWHGLKLISLIAVIASIHASLPNRVSVPQESGSVKMEEKQTGDDSKDDIGKVPVEGDMGVMKESKGDGTSGYTTKNAGAYHENIPVAEDAKPKNENGPKTHTWKDWPAVAYEEVGHDLVMKGDTFFNHAREHYFTKNSEGKTLMDEFMEFYINRPDKINLCGIRINHAMALFLAVRQIQPSLVVESGVNAGQSTYFIRAASNTTKIFAIDPEDKPICRQGNRWIDSSELTTYFIGENFVDLIDLDWKGMIEKKEVDPESTLVYLDDHQHAYSRIKAVTEHGIQHVMSEDNYKVGEGSNPIDRRSSPKQIFSLRQNNEEKESVRLFFDNHVKTYAEFPILVPPIMAKEWTEPKKAAGAFMHAADKNEDIVAPILRPDLDEDDLKLYKDIVAKLDYDPSLKDKESYMEFMNYCQIAYLKLSPETS